MTGSFSQCADLHQLLRTQQRNGFPPPFAELPLNGIYFIFERGQQTHDGVQRIVRVGSHRGWNNLVPRLWQHITPHGRSSFRWDVGAAILAERRPGFEHIPEAVWAVCDTVARKPPHRDQWVGPLDRFETQLSAFIAEQFTFSAIGTDNPKEALELEKACIGIVAGCDHCRAAAMPTLSPRMGRHLWNTQHISYRGPLLTEKQWALLGRHSATVD
jgi:hypothetical protein